MSVKRGIGVEITEERLRLVLEALLPGELPRDVPMTVDWTPEIGVLGVYFVKYGPEEGDQDPGYSDRAEYLLRTVGEGAPIPIIRLDTNPTSRTWGGGQR